MHKNGVTYLSILRWPNGTTAVDRAEMLVAVLGMEPYQAGLTVRRGFPQVILRTDRERAESLVEALLARGIESFAAPRARMRSAPGVLRIHTLRTALGAPQAMYECEPSRGGPFALIAADIALLVRGSVVSTETGTHDPSTPLSVPQAAALSASGLDTMVSFRSARTRISEVLDLFLRDGSRLRIEADHFNFDLLGQHRPRTDRQRLDALALRLAAEAQDAVLDGTFAQFHCPIDIIRTHHAGAGEADSRRSPAMAAFDFYSVWAWLRITMGNSAVAA